MKDYKDMTLAEAKARILEIKEWQDETGKAWDNESSEPKVELHELEHLQKHFKLSNGEVNRIVGAVWLGDERKPEERNKMKQLMEKENIAQEEVEQLSTDEINTRLGITEKPAEKMSFK